MSECALIVESSFSTRLGLVRDLEESGLVGEIQEAKSVDDGIDRLRKDEINACLLGPTLSEEVTVDFVRRGKIATRKTDCAFVAILAEGTHPSVRLRSVGVHGTLTKPYEQASFTQLVNQAIDHAKHGSVYEIAESWSPTVVAERLDVVVSKLRTLAEKLASGELSLQRDGTPSLATRDSLRLAFECAFPPDSQVQQIGSFDHLFVTSIIEWFEERVDNSHQVATEHLRQKLVDHHEIR